MNRILIFLLCLLISDIVFAQNVSDQNTMVIERTRQNEMIAEGRFNREQISEAFLNYRNRTLDAFSGYTIFVDAIGWSSNGLFAYRNSFYSPAYPASGYELVIFDSVTDTIIDRSLLSFGPSFEDDELTTEERIDAAKNTWNELLRTHGIAGEIGNHVEKISGAVYETFEGKAYEAWFNYNIDLNENIRWELVVGIENRQKIISSGYGFTENLSGKKIVGYFRSPYEDRIVIMTITIGRGGTGEVRPAADVDFYGCDMRIGFN